MPETPVFAAAAVAAPHHLAAEAGRAILIEGGNAIEAMVAMAATVAVAYPHMNGLGGDAFWLVREPGGRLRAIEACGPAGALATPRRYRDKGFDAIPARGPDAALTVAGAVGGWRLALDYARSLGGRLPLASLLADAGRRAADGVPVSRSEARTVPADLPALREAPGFATAFLAEGRQPEAGALRRQPALAATLEQLAHAGLDDFYRGDVGRELAGDLERIGAPVTRADLQRFEARVVQPLSLRFGPATLHNLPPPTQGLASLLILGILDRLGLGSIGRGAESVALHHGLIEAAKRAARIRDRVVTDPAHLTEDPAGFLTPAALEREAAAIDMRRAAPGATAAPAEGDTIWMGAIDGTGLAVSYIQSIYWEWGSGCVLPATGVLWQNRGLSFALNERARNPLQPGRKPFHTLNPAMAVFDDGRVAPYGCMGGEGQPQFQAQVFARYALLGQGVAEAVDAPRWLLGRTWGADSATLKAESRFDAGLIEGLARLGHAVEEVGEPYSDALGHAGLLVRHPRDGRIEAAHDPRADGGASGV